MQATDNNILKQKLQSSYASIEIFKSTDQQIVFQETVAKVKSTSSNCQRIKTLLVKFFPLYKY